MNSGTSNKFYQEATNIFEDYILTLPKDPHNLYDAIRYFLKLGGKRVRPVLTLMTSAFFSESKHGAKAAIALELFHNFTLIHDDIMDQSPQRRNLQTIHLKWNLPVAILAGDTLLVKAFQEINQCGTYSEELTALLSTTAVEVCEGQQLDMNFESRFDITESDYLQMIRLKTAVLFGCCLKAGAICGKASTITQAVLYDAGVKLGIAFQLMDDFLDTYGDPQITGKQLGGDILSNKKTWLSSYVLQKGSEEQKKNLISWCRLGSCDKSEKITAVKKVFDELNIREILENKIDEIFNEASDRIATHLSGLDVGSQKIENFMTYISYLRNRKN